MKTLLVTVLITAVGVEFLSASIAGVTGDPYPWLPIAAVAFGFVLGCIATAWIVDTVTRLAAKRQANSSDLDGKANGW